MTMGFNPSHHNYMKMIYRLYQDGDIPIDGLHRNAHVKHDNWCDGLNGRGYCNCRPTVKIGSSSYEFNDVMGRG